MKPAILLDSNLLLLLVLGSFDLRLIASFKRLSAFSTADFYLLRDFTRKSRLATTPHVLTEVSNLANALPQSVRAPCLRYFAVIASAMEEVYMPSAELASHKIFPLFGLTDSAVSVMAKTTILLTEDGRLRAYLAQEGRISLGLSDLRQLRAADSSRF